MNNNSSNNNSNCSNNMNNSNNRNNNNTNKKYKKKKVKILKAMKRKFPSRWNKFQKSSFIPPSVTRTVLVYDCRNNLDNCQIVSIFDKLKEITYLKRYYNYFD